MATREETLRNLRFRDDFTTRDAGTMLDYVDQEVAVAVGGHDNLGDHTATEPLEMQTFDINGVVLINGANSADGVDSENLVIQAGSPAGATTADGAEVIITGGASQDLGSAGDIRITGGLGDRTAGGAVSIFAGSIQNGTAATGGVVTIMSGAGGATGPSGSVNLSTPTALGGTANAGAISLRPGTGGSGGGVGGLIELVAGNGAGGGAGGQVDITGGRGTFSGVGDGGAITITSGEAFTGASGDLTLQTGVVNTSGSAGAINILGGSPITDGQGGDIFLTAGNGGTNSGNGGDITLRTGDTGASSTENPGNINIIAGFGAISPFPANVNLTATGGGTVSDGGPVTIRTGDGGTTGARDGGIFQVIVGRGGTAGAGTGGAVDIRAGDGGFVGGTGGAFDLHAGGGGATSGAGGLMTIRGGTCVTDDGIGGAVDIAGGAGGGNNAGGAVIIDGGVGGDTGGVGGAVGITAGSAAAGGDIGGSITLTPGLGEGAGVDGSVVVLTNGTFSEPALLIGATGTRGLYVQSNILSVNGPQFSHNDGAGPALLSTLGASTVDLGVPNGIFQLIGGSGTFSTGVARIALASSTVPDVDILAGDTATSDLRGGNLNIAAGLGNGTGVGGILNLDAGKGGTTAVGGDADIKAGDGGVTSGAGGNVALEGGDLDGSSTPAENGIVEVRGALGYQIQSGGTVVAATDFNPDAGLTVEFTFGAAATAEIGFTTCKTFGVEMTVEVTNGGQGTLTWGAEVEWAGGVAPTLTAAGKDLLKFYTRDGGTTWMGWPVALDLS